LPVRQAVNRTGDANLSSEFASKHIGESECRQSACQTTTHRHVTGKLKNLSRRRNMLRTTAQYAPRYVMIRSLLTGFRLMNCIGMPRPLSEELRCQTRPPLHFQILTTVLSRQFQPMLQAQRCKITIPQKILKVVKLI
jgi:hypothetical protein